MYNKLKLYLVLFFAFAVIFKSAQHAGFFKSTTYKGGGFSMKIPAGFELDKDKTGQFPSQDSTEPLNMATFVTPELILPGNEPAADVVATSKKLKQAMWIEDEWPAMLKQFHGRYKVIDQGEIFLDQQLMKWVFYDDAKAKRLFIEYYTVTDGSLLVKLAYSAHASGQHGDKFKTYRPAFEEARESFKFTFGVF